MVRPRISEQELNRIAVRGGKIKRRSSRVPTAAEVAAASESRAPVPSRPESASPSPLPVDNSVPMAAMAASMGAINRQLGDIVEHNSRVIEGFKADLSAMMAQRPKRRPWDFHVLRDRNRLIERVRAVPLED